MKKLNSSLLLLSPLSQHFADHPRGLYTHSVSKELILSSQKHAIRFPGFQGGNLTCSPWKLMTSGNCSIGGGSSMSSSGSSNRSSGSSQLIRDDGGVTITIDTPTSQKKKSHSCPTHPDVTGTVRALTALHPDWRRVMGFLDIERLSYDWFDLHPEERATGWVRDCTHYVVNPVMFDAIWLALTQFISGSNNDWLMGRKCFVG